jgi:hypothetical protein
VGDGDISDNQVTRCGKQGIAVVPGGNAAGPGEVSIGWVGSMEVASQIAEGNCNTTLGLLKDVVA